MKNHLQPVTARANAGIKKSSDCGCGSPAKLDPITIMKTAKIAGGLLGGNKQKTSSSVSSSGAVDNNISKDFSTSSAAPTKKYGKKY